MSMRFIVCIKQVPATTNVEIDPKTGTLKREGVESIINPFDEYAIEEGIRLKESNSGSETIVITMGPPQAEFALREALSRGIDKAYLITDKIFAGADTLATAYTLAQAIRYLGSFDLIICGKQAADGDTAQVGPSLAEKLNIPHIAYVKKIEEIKPGYIRIQRLMEDGYEILETSLPALITVVKEINTPRLPTLRGMLIAKKSEIPKLNKKTINVDEKKVGLTGSPTQVIKIFYPPPRKGGKRITGEPQDMAKKLVENLKELQLI